MSPYDRTTYDAKPVDWLTRAALEEAATDYGQPFDLSQGSYSPGFGPSAGTHNGGGTVDSIPTSLADARAQERALRKAGFAAWVRVAVPGLWPLHVHAVQMGNRKLSAAAKAQVLEYLGGLDGLAGDGRDTGPREFVDVRFRWFRGRRRILRARQLIEKARLQLATGIRGHEVEASRQALREALRDLPNPK